MNKQKRWGKKVIYARDWRNLNESYVTKATFYLEFEWVKSWNSELKEMNLRKRGAQYKFPNSLIKLQAIWLNFFSYRGAEGITKKFVDRKSVV